MLPILDFKVDGGDDIIISGDDFSLETNTGISAFRCGERRCQARYDDFILTPSISAGIETVIQQYINELTMSDIEQKIKSSLQEHQLFSSSDFKVYIHEDTYDKHKLKVLVSFNLPSLVGDDQDYNFSVIVNIENQRAFR